MRSQRTHEPQIFINGLLDTSAVTTFGPKTGTAALRIGAAGGAGGHYFSGLIDEVRVTAGARYVRSFTPDRAQGADRSDTRGLWKFDAQTAHDSSGKNNHGTFAGGASCSTACPAAEKAPSQWVTTQTADQPITIDFDLYSHGTAITTQYPPAVFSSGPNQLPVAYNPRLNPNEFATAVSPPNTITRYNNFWPFNFSHSAPLTVEFTRPVNNLRFWITAVDAFWGNHILDVDIYQNGIYKATWGISSLGYGVNMFVNVGYPNNQVFGVNEVTKIVIKNIDDPWGLGFDDFTFNAPEALKLDLTNPRVGGNIQGTVQKALLGADVRLQAVPNRGGGTYSWSVTGPHQRVSTSADQSAILERWTDTGTYRVTATYSLNGETTSSSVDVNVIVPTLSSFTANKSSDRITDDDECFAFGPSLGTVRYMLGCPTPPERPDNPNHILGITFSATAQIPPVQYLSDPAQSGIKIVQIISSYNKALAFGSTVCITTRGSESDVQSGWQLDLADPYTQRPT